MAFVIVMLIACAAGGGCWYFLVKTKPTSIHRLREVNDDVDFQNADIELTREDADEKATSSRAVVMPLD